MSRVTKLILDWVGDCDRLTADSPSFDDLHWLLETLKNRREGTLYLMCEREFPFLCVGVCGDIWLAHLSRERDSLCLANQRSFVDEVVEFNFANTGTPIPARLTCSQEDVLRACEAFFECPDELPLGNWATE